MPLMTTRAAASVKAFGLTILAALTSVIDTFNRANQSGLGSIKGQKWKIWRGVWEILSNRAASSSAASTNALATLKFTKTDVTVSVSGVDPGMGASFWVTDANNWYASVYTQTQTCQTCSNCSGTWNASTCNAWNAQTCSGGQNCINSIGNCAFGTVCCGGFNPCSAWNACNAWSCSTFNSANSGNFNPPFGFCWGPSRVCNAGQNCSSPGTCNANCCNGPFPTWSPYCSGSYNACTSWNAANCSGNFNASNCNAFFSFSCNCVTEHRVNLIRSIAGTVSNISLNLFSAAIASFRTALSGNTATITAFSAENYATQIGSPVATNISPAPVKAKSHGIIKSSSPFSQGNSINDFGVS